MGAIGLGIFAHAQKTTSVQDTTAVKLSEVLVWAVRAQKKQPVSFSNLSQQHLKKTNAGQQIPMLISQLPNVVNSSEDGLGFGATSFSVRGSDTYRTNVTINGIPYNDPESQGTFWYNLSDFATSAQSLQLQRGVGTSTNGAGSFGASLNILTENPSENPSAEIANFFGSFNSLKHSAKISTGNLGNFNFQARFSKVNSDGYRERSASKLQSYFVQGIYKNGNTLLKGLLFGGKEKTQLTWIGVTAETLENNRRYNPAGKYEKDGKTLFYDNETDNYTQNHAQLHWVQQWQPHFTTTTALHYTKGKGYWEMYENWGSLAINQYWLDNDFYGGTFSANYKKESLSVAFGSAYNQYDGQHYTQFIWGENTTTPHHSKSATEMGYKKDANTFAKIQWEIIDNLSLYADLQYRYVNYRYDTYKANENFHFFNPKFGLNYDLNSENQLYFSYAQANKEPNRNDYKNAYKEKLNRNPQAEQLNDFELGWRYTTSKISLSANAYYMKYTNELVPTGKLNDKGYPIRANSGNSHRLGIETEVDYKISEKWQWQGSFSFNENKHKEYQQNNHSKNNATIAFSPSVVAFQSIHFLPISNLKISVIGKFVGKQYMSNMNEENSILPNYFVSNLHINYDIYPKKFCEKITLSVMGNNIFNRKYVSGGTYEEGIPAYFAQATANVLGGIILQF